jgi:HD-GYP domain-containing protein (c-di-GMP phosphodiesterase class II)
MEVMRRHPIIGEGIVKPVHSLSTLCGIIRHHHEWLDGTGYPDGLKGDKIPLGAKILAVSDSFDAMTSKRTYRDAMTVEQALAEIEKGFGTQFDERLGRVFVDSDVGRLWNIIRDGFSEVYGNSRSEEYGAAAVGTLIR